MVGVGGGTPVLHEADAVSRGVCERPVAASSVVGDGDVYLQAIYDCILRAKRQSVDDVRAFPGPVEYQVLGIEKIG